MPTVSVIIPFHGRIDWMLEAVASVLAQTYRDFELIVVNDGASQPFDLSRLGGDPRILYLQQENRGPAAARNAGIARARGKFIAFLDADDLYRPTKLEVQAACMEAHPEAILSHTSYLRMRADGTCLGQVDSGEFEGAVYPRIVTSCRIATPTVMLRRVALGGLRFEEQFRCGEDVMLWTRIARLGPIVGIREPLSVVRMHGGNAADDPGTQLVANMQILDRAMALDPELGPGFRSRARSEMFKSVAAIFARRRDWPDAVSFLARAVPEHARGYGMTSLVGWTFSPLLRRLGWIPRLTRPGTRQRR
jgi:glycosyltransferase involved in cell wall biosynthesis